MTVQTTMLKDVAMVMLNISIWSGAKKLEPSDFINVDVDDLPSSRVASYGIKHLIEKERLQPFKTIRGQAERICIRYGTRLLGGYAIPQDFVDAVGNELSQLCVKFEAEIDAFIAQYDQAIEDWIATNPDFAEPLRRSMLPRGEVRSRFKASFSIFEVSASPRDTTNSLASVGTDLFDSVLGTFVSAIKPQLDRKVGGVAPDWFRVEVRQIIVDAAQKLRRFSFVDPSGGMKVLADDLEALVSGNGKIAGPDADRLWNVIKHFSSVANVKKAISDRASGLLLTNGASAPTEQETIKDDLGFPMGGFGQDGDQAPLPLPAHHEPTDDAFPALSLNLDSDDPAQDHQPVQQVRPPFTASLDF